MTSNGGFDDNDDDLTPGFYSQLLFNDDDHQEASRLQGQFTTSSSQFSSADVVRKNDGGISNRTSGDYSHVITPKMLCFGDLSEPKQCNNDIDDAFGVIMSIQNSGIGTCMEDSKVVKTPNNSNRKRKACSSGSAGEMKKCKRDESCPNNNVVTRHAKVAKKEKLGDRITALQQIVSPFGKTDTASVLHEALGYIRFLQDQVQVLCSPYLHRPPSDHSSAPPFPGDNCEQKECVRRGEVDLKSRGLCLVPVESIRHVANDSNGADLWSSATMVNNVF